MDDSQYSIWRILVGAISPRDDARGRQLCAQLRHSGYEEVTSVRSERVYQVGGRLDQAAVRLLADRLFADPVIERWSCADTAEWPAGDGTWVEVHPQPGVMDPAAISALAAARDLLSVETPGGNSFVDRVRTGWRYRVGGVSDSDRLAALCRDLLANPCVESVFVCTPDRRDELPLAFPTPVATSQQVRTVSLRELSDAELAQLSRRGHLFLSIEEMRAIRDHYEALGRDPIDAELETLAQTWSEHCVHKTITSEVEYDGLAFGQAGDRGGLVQQRYRNLLADTIMQATRQVDKPWCLSVFADNAGIVTFDDDFGVAFKVETHNHPSAIEPYGGAATGTGGCIRDILGCGLGAKPVAATDVFCVAPPDYSKDRLPAGVLHPRRVLRGVVSGVRDYGNRMGIPTLAGALRFHERYLANPLVFCGCVGLIPRDRIEKKPLPGDAIVLLGGRTGRDGIGGATFSSAELTDTHADEFAHAVQIGNPIEEKKVAGALLRARDEAGGCLYTSVTDCGAGGLSSAVGEMAHPIGAEVDLDMVPVKYDGLRYNEVWLSEAQERMVLAVPEGNVARLMEICAEEDVEATVIGRFGDDGVLRLRYEGEPVGQLEMSFLHDGRPRRRRKARWDGDSSSPATDTASVASVFGEADVENRLLDSLRSLNVCSRESVFRQYDQDVQGQTVLRPLVGRGEGPSDAAVIRPRIEGHRGVAIGMGLGVQLPGDDPYWMAVRAIDEAIRNVVCVGADIGRISLLDNFCWGGCEDEVQMGALVRACQACCDAAIAYDAPFISGKDSLNNQYALEASDASRLGMGSTIAIPPTLLISSIGLIDDVRACVTSDLKPDAGKLLFASVDLRRDGSAAAARLHADVSKLIAGGHVAACHDVSDGGMAACIAEMCIGGGCGASIDMDALAGQVGDAFWEVGSRSGYVLQLATGEGEHAGVKGDVVTLGNVVAAPGLTLRQGQRVVAEISVENLASAWRSGLVID